jgi:hypothetical protein
MKSEARITYKSVRLRKRAAKVEAALFKNGITANSCDDGHTK